MSVIVNIEYRQPDPTDGEEKTLTSRRLEIRRADIEGNHTNRLDGEYEYEVHDHRGRSATFRHTFGDNLTTLIGKAGQALVESHRVL